MSTNKTPIQHAFGVEPMDPKDLPMPASVIVDVGNRAGLDLRGLSPDEDVCFAYSDLIKFFHIVVEDCAVVAEQQARIYSNGDAGDGCHRAASAIRTYGKQHG